MKSGYIYLIEFSNGVVKPGRTCDLYGRYYRLKKTAEKLKLSVDRFAHTPEKSVTYMTDEQELISRLRLVSGQGIGEYFHDVSFDYALKQFRQIRPDALLSDVEVNRLREKRLRSISVSDEDWDMVKHIARKRGMNVSNFVSYLARKNS